MDEDTKIVQTTRRAVLKTFAATAVVFPILGQDLPHGDQGPVPVAKQLTSAQQYHCFTPDQIRTLDALTETIIPTDAHSPGAKTAGVSEYIDVVVAGTHEGTKDLWDQGIALANDLAINSFGKPYADCSAEEQIGIMGVLAADEHSPNSTGGRFFSALKHATIFGYYTSAIGIHQDLQYQGNQALSAFPGCPHEHHA